MKTPHENDYVRLRQDIPELLLARGEIGVVRGRWYEPVVAYEVEFHPVGVGQKMLALLKGDQLEMDEMARGANPSDQGM